MFRKVALFLVCCMVTAISSPIVYAEKSREIFAEWDFRSGRADGWAAQSGNWSVVKDGDIYAYRQPTASSGSTCAAIGGDASWTDYSLECDVTPLNIDKGNPFLFVRGTDAGNNYSLSVSSTGLGLSVRTGWIGKTLASYSTTIKAGTAYKVRINLYGSKITVFLNDAMILSVDDSTHSSGRIGVWTWQSSVQISNVKVTEAEKIIEVEGLYLDKNNITTKIGGTVGLVPMITPENASIKTVNYSSSDPGVATVSYKGEITGVASGQAVITATTQDGGFAEKCVVSVVGDKYNDTNGHWAEKDIDYTSANGVFNGVGAAVFGVDKTITRAELFTACVRILEASPNEYNGIYTDVSKNDWYSKYVQVAYDYGLIFDKMTPDKRFDANKNITRAETAAVLAKIFSYKNKLIPPKYELSDFSDCDDVEDWLMDDVELAYSLGLVVGNDGKLMPESCITRAEAATMVARLLKVLDFDEQIFLDGFVSVRKNLNKIGTFLKKFEGAEETPQEIQITKYMGDAYEYMIQDDIKYKRLELARREIEALKDILDDTVKQIETGYYYLCKEKTVRGKNIKNGMFYNKNDEPVFLRSAIWMGKLRNYWPESGGTLASSKNMFFNITSSWCPIPSDTFPTKESVNTMEGEHPTTKKTDFRDSIIEHYENNMLVDILMQDQNVPHWMVEEDPTVKTSGNHYYVQDPDHEDARYIMQKNFEWYFTVLRGLPTEIVNDTIFAMDMHNEPQISSMTQHSFKRFQKMLEDKYKTIEKLNSKWETDYKSFAQINNLNDLEKVCETNINAKADYKNYTMQRMTDIFAMLKKVIDDNKGDFNIDAHIKLMDNTYLDTDMEALADIQTILGCDCYIGPIETDKYSMDWVNQSFYYDLYKALQPDKPIYDSEWHGIDTVTVRNLEISKGYTATALRMAALHGLAGTTVWAFARPEAEATKMPEPLMFLQPYVVNEFATESVKIDNEMERISPFVNSEKKVYVLYSKESILKQYKDYTTVLRTVFENLNFNDIPISFVSERMLQDKDFLEDNNVEMLVVPYAKHIPEKAIEGINTLADNGVPVIMIDGCSVQNENNDVRNIKGISIDLADDYEEVLREYVEKYIDKEFHIKYANPEEKQYVQIRFAEYDGKKIGYAVNVGKTEAKFTVENQSGETQMIAEFDYGRTKEPQTEVVLKPMEYISFDIVE